MKFSLNKSTECAVLALTSVLCTVSEEAAKIIYGPVLLSRRASLGAVSSPAVLTVLGALLPLIGDP